MGEVAKMLLDLSPRTHMSQKYKLQSVGKKTRIEVDPAKPSLWATRDQPRTLLFWPTECPMSPCPMSPCPKFTGEARRSDNEAARRTVCDTGGGGTRLRGDARPLHPPASQGRSRGRALPTQPPPSDLVLSG